MHLGSVINFTLTTLRILCVNAPTSEIVELKYRLIFILPLFGLVRMMIHLLQQ